jgi:hypothetical protein
MPGGVGGAEPRGSSLSRSLALRDRYRGIEFTVAIGGTADMPQPRGVDWTDVNDPEQSLASLKSCIAASP